MQTLESLHRHIETTVDLRTIVKTMKTTINGVAALKARIYYSKLFCDNTYGVNAIGWQGR